ncbi:MAG: type 2 isopentenyl-diphosphate Delta-isomerase [Melioribacteraceae bacterium]|nr:type 2 isopentenyl-diphosphate Delta-isomerase [Melioribacteraceae bacterium]
MSSDEITKRKKDHIEICSTDKANFRNKTAGFEYYDFKHYAITELNLEQIDIAQRFFNKTISAPLIISCMTGGVNESKNINHELAKVAQHLKIPIGSGSQRALIEDRAKLKSFSIIREAAPDVPILANIGAAQVAQGIELEDYKFIIDSLEADALVVHVNPLQELIQHRGEPNFKGLLNNLESLIRKITIPVIVKEVGSGINGEAAEKLLEIGVKGVDVAGAGGTSWSAVEYLRNEKNADELFWDWGLPTSFCIKDVNKLKENYNFILIGSGGIKNGFDAAKSIALGADLVASAGTFFRLLKNAGAEKLIEVIEEWISTIKKVMYLTNSRDLKELRENKLIKVSDYY